jgi:cytochrome P450
LSISTDKAARGRNPDLDRAFRELADFVTEEVGIRRLDPRDDLITRLAEAEIDGDRLTDREVVLTTSMFVVAGIESLSSFMSIFAVNLQEFSDARRATYERTRFDCTGNRGVAAIQYIRPALQACADP